MSLDTCRCGKIVDTDHDCDAYFVTNENGEEINLDYCLCANCREEFQGLLELKKKTERFKSEIFDWVSCIGDISMLERVREFESRIEAMINPRSAQ